MGTGAQASAARGRPIIVEWERDARHSAGLSLVRHADCISLGRHLRSCCDNSHGNTWEGDKITSPLVARAGPDSRVARALSWIVKNVVLVLRSRSNDRLKERNLHGRYLEVGSEKRKTQVTRASEDLLADIVRALDRFAAIDPRAVGGSVSMALSAGPPPPPAVT
ncbi:hypothetical protein EVAR_894_1 [Eumeta japonica]|uniref:Uncharacterized protein n=1 Tax=Eumeta variegata TaxID=151549 RepID=A0A4C1SGK4_EUMVA|nr:hypothetical protein EVAR_894_1 [Eumeta japonica]